MSKFEFLDKIKMPVYICNCEWQVIYRNTACKKYTTAPRVKGSMLKFFADGEKTFFPERNSGISFIACVLKNSYRIALAFEYESNAVLIFPALLEYDLLFGEFSSRVKKDFATVWRDIFDLLAK